jgi:hypothetical protein
LHTHDDTIKPLTYQASKDLPSTMKQRDTNL